MENNKRINIFKIYVTSILSVIILSIGISAFQKAIDAVSIKKMLFEVAAIYISIFAFHLSNSILKDYISEYKK